MAPSSHSKMQRYSGTDLLPQRQFSSQAERNARRLRAENARIFNNALKRTAA